MRTKTVFLDRDWDSIAGQDLSFRTQFWNVHWYPQKDVDDPSELGLILSDLGGSAMYELGLDEVATLEVQQWGIDKDALGGYIWAWVKLTARKPMLR
jgi:hypothetical protein